MVVAVTEVVDIVSSDRVLAVLQFACIGSLHVPSEVGFERGCAGVEQGHHIGVICPRIPEGKLQLVRFEWLKRQASGRAFSLQVEKLDVGDAAREHTLDDVCAVKAVHTVCPHNSFLLFEHLARLRVDWLVQSLQ